MRIAEHRICPYCGGKINTRATKCQYCLSTDPNLPEDNKKAYIKGLSGQFAGKIIPFNDGQLIVGRNPEIANIVYHQSQDYISRKHLIINYNEVENIFILEDYSSNGTFLFPDKKLESSTPYHLKPGVKFYLSDPSESFVLCLDITEYKICPYCSEEIKAKAIKCKCCYTYLDEDSVKQIEKYKQESLNNEVSEIMENHTIQWFGENYTGQLKDDKPHGKGRLEYKDGHIYEGEWVNGKKHGSGELIYPSGAKYIGKWVSDVINGEGFTIHPEVEQNNYIPLRKESIIWNNGTFHGVLKEGVPHGKGTWCSNKDGEILIGVWENGSFVHPLKIKEGANNNIYSNRCYVINNSKWDLGGIFITVSAVIAVLSMFMRWVDIGIVAQSGLQQGTILYLGFWFYPLLTVVKNNTMSLTWGLIYSIGSFLATVIYIASKTIELFGETIIVAGTGAWLYLVVSLVLVVGVCIYKPVDN